MAFLVVAVLSAAGWWAIARHDDRLAEAVLEQRANTVQAALRASIVARAESIRRMAQRLAQAPDEAALERQFDIDARIYLQHYPSLRSLTWAGPDRVVRHVLAQPGAPVLPAGATLEFDPDPLAVGNAEPAASRSRLLEGSNGELLVARNDGESGHQAAYLVAALDYGRLFPDVLEGIEPGLPLRISQGGRVIHARGVPEGVAAALDRQVANQGQEARIELWHASGEALTSRFGDILFVAGLLVGALLALALHLWTRSRERAEQAERAGEALTMQIAENEAAQEARRAVERELSSVFESISDAFYTLDDDWRFVLVNPRAEQLMRTPRQEMVGKRVWDVFPAALGTEIETSFRRAAAEKITVEFDVYFLPLASWFNARVFPHPNGVAVYFQDVSARKRAELGMLKAQATSERAQRLAQLGSWEYDLSTGELHWSEEVHRIFGIAEARLARGLPALLERVHFDDRVALQQAQRRLHNGEGDIDIEYRVLRPDGETRIVRELGTPGARRAGPAGGGGRLAAGHHRPSPQRGCAA
ncbi:PAS domain-containing protein [Arenimonas daejeonensis]|uniref:PAS domain-containing protein n=1 Tax=Arenimonas daejeonensis TaxID=370777 RepID=UPI0013159D7A|nr:PAS domain-containing protein [Arenimonas daejeonensis]